MRQTRLGFHRRRVVHLRLERHAERRAQHASACKVCECLFQDRNILCPGRDKEATRRILCRQAQVFRHTATPGTDFQYEVWNALLNIPYGTTKSYKDIAQSIGKPQAVRAVAGAIGANGISILIPCHRVIGCNNSLTGYAGGLEAKKVLLGIETQK